MSFEEIGGNKKYINPKEFNPGDTLVEGYFVGPVKGQFGINYDFRTVDGNVVCLNGKGQLHWKLEQIQAGDYIKVIYKGLEKITSKRSAMFGKDAHSFDVLRDATLSRGTAKPATNPAATPADADEDDEDIF